jgi:hypothetical protein
MFACVDLMSTCIMRLNYRSKVGLVLYTYANLCSCLFNNIINTNLCSCLPNNVINTCNFGFKLVSDLHFLVLQ